MKHLLTFLLLFSCILGSTAYGATRSGAVSTSQIGSQTGQLTTPGYRVVIAAEFKMRPRQNVMGLASEFSKNQYSVTFRKASRDERDVFINFTGTDSALPLTTVYSIAQKYGVSQNNVVILL